MADQDLLDWLNENYPAPPAESADPISARAQDLTKRQIKSAAYDPSTMFPPEMYEKNLAKLQSEDDPKQGYIGRSLGYVPNTMNPGIPMNAAEVALAGILPKAAPSPAASPDEAADTPAASASLAPKRSLAAAAAPAAPQANFGPPTLDKMNPDAPVKDPNLREYLLQKLKSDFSDERYQDARRDANERKSKLGWAQFAAGLGDALAGRSPSESAQMFDRLRQEADQNTTGAFEARKKQLIENAGAEAQAIQQKKQADQADPNSNASQSFRKMIEANFPQIAKAYGDSWKNVTAGDSEAIFNPLKLKEQIAERREAAQMRAEMQRQGQQDRHDRQQDAAAQKVDALLESSRQTPDVMQAYKDRYAIQKANSLAAKYPDPDKMSNQEVNLLVQELGKVATGGVPTMHELEGLTPGTLSSKFGSTWSKLANSPSPANAGAFVRQYRAYLNDIGDTAQKAIDDKIGRVLDTNRRLMGEENYNVRRARYAPIQKAESPAQKIKVSNGKETLMIDPSDLPHAQADGYRQVQ